MNEPSQRIHPAVAEAIKQIVGVNGEQDTRLAEHTTALKYMGRQVDEMHKAILGNGNPTDNGLVGQVAALRAAQRITWKMLGLCVAGVAAVVAVVTLIG